MSEPSTSGSAPSCCPRAARELADLVATPVPAAPHSTVYYPDCACHPEDDGTLYPYQRRSRDVLRAPGRKNLLVASPTGSGKTFVIEECVRLAREADLRLLIGEPLIALAEQIYSRIGGEDLAMRTGPSRKGSEGASVVVGTYEALARMASTEPEFLTGCPRIVIDEFHFLGSDRGPVLQELLASCREGREVVALSGTMPNVHELACFLSRLNGFPTYVVGAPRRPIEISFYHYACAEDAMSHLRPAARPPPFRAQDIGGVRDRQGLFRLLDQLQTWDCYPALFVTFSCKRLDDFAEWASSRGFSDRTSRRHVAVGFRKLLRSVPAEDAPLFQRYRAWADAGVAVHHSHAPVQYLELVSWLAERRALALVFSSSTLSAGINLPVRTVCLASASVPQKSSDGGVTHADISPMLFHQLVGRAGRPGYETVGNCILLGRSRWSYGSAQALMQCPVEPVKPHAAFGSGEVLRALRWHRSLAHEAMAVLSAAEHELVRQSERDAWLAARALQLHPEPEKLRRQANAALLFEGLPASLREYARVQSAENVVLALQDSTFSVGAPEDFPGADVAPLTCRQSIKKLPFTDATRIFEARAAAKALLASRGLDEADAAVRTVFYNSSKSAARLSDAPLQEAYRATLAELRAAGCVDGADCLTALGAAACELRICPQPHLVLRCLLAAGQLSSRDALLFASQVLGEGGGSEGGGGGQEKVLASLETPGLGEALRRLHPLSSPIWTLSAERWYDGAASLADLEADVAVGCMCRHLLRTSDCCEEISQALRALGAGSEAFEQAKARISRGLPFLKRGAWKAHVDDDEDDEDS